MKKCIFLIISILLIISCAKDPMDTPLTKDNYEQVIEQIRKNSDKKTWDAINGLIQLSAFARAFSGDSAEYGSFPNDWSGKTFNEILQEIKVRMDKADEEERARIDEQKKINYLIDNSVRIDKIDVWGDKSVPQEWSIDISFHNISNIKISKFYGTLTIVDNSGNEYSRQHIVYNAHDGFFNPDEYEKDSYDFIEPPGSEVVDLLITGKKKLTMLLNCNKIVSEDGISYVYTDIKETE